MVDKSSQIAAESTRRVGDNIVILAEVNILFDKRDIFRRFLKELIGGNRPDPRRNMSARRTSS